MSLASGAAKSSDAGKELCEALGIDWHNVYEVVLLYEAGEVVIPSGHLLRARGEERGGDMNLPDSIGKVVAPWIGSEATYEWLKSDEVEMTIHQDRGNRMMVGQHVRLILGNKLYVFEIVGAEWRDVGDADAADLTLKLMTVEDTINC